jgi:hypothetical protein
MTRRIMKKYFVVIIFSLIISVLFYNQKYEYNLLYPTPGIKENPIANYEGFEEEDLSNVMVPIPMKDRVFNKSGIQCVWATLETCGRFAEEPKLIDLTNKKDFQGLSNPLTTSVKLKNLNVKFEQITNKTDRSLIIKSVVEEKRGCMFGIPGHAMTLVHYDEKEKIVKYINNSDPTLAIRVWSMDQFNKSWNGWICVIYADVDKINKIPQLPVIDRNNPQGKYPKDYIFRPNK